jgi:hypothetical protein
MTRTISAPTKSRRWFALAFGILLGLAAICHGCHFGDHDDELSASGRIQQKHGERGPDGSRSP